MKLVVLIPAYNEEENIVNTINKVPRKIKGIDEVQVMVVDDGSSDGTAKEVKKTDAILVSYKPNGGVGKAFKTGLEKTLEIGADILVNIDADGQFDPNDIPLIIDPIIKGDADFVASDRFTGENGKPRRPENMPKVKYWGNQRMNWLVNILSGKKFPDVSCGFRAYSKKTMFMLNLQGKFTYTQESFLDLATKDLRIVSVPVRVVYGKTIRKSKVFKGVFDYAFRTSYIIFRSFRDYRPLTFFGLIGLFFFFLSLLTGTVVLIHFLTTGGLTPYKAYGFISIYTLSLALLVWVVGIFADMLDRVRNNQENILYYEKMNYYNNRKKD
ncbi:MAG: glycosyltransferase family 2 protein [Candidatus Pacearchaeota archaeon]